MDYYQLGPILTFYQFKPCSINAKSSIDIPLLNFFNIMDKNSAIGFGLLMVLLLAYVFINKDNAETEANKTKTEQAAITDSTVNNAVSTSDSIATVETPVAAINVDENIPEETLVLENEDVKISFTNIGAYPKEIELKKFTTYDKQPLILYKGSKNYFDFIYNQNGITKNSKAQSFKPALAADGQSVSFLQGDSSGAGFAITYTLPAKGYMMDMVVKPSGADKSKNIVLNWASQSLHTEKDKAAEKLYTEVCYNLAKDGFDNYTINEQNKEDFEGEAINWLGFKQHFFNTTLVPQDKFILSGEVISSPVNDSLKQKVSNFDAKLTLMPKDELRFQFYAGPNDYDGLKALGQGLEEIIPMSYGIFGFVKYINKWMIIPIFKGLASIFSNYGIVIIILTLIIRLLMSPLTYKSYVSSAKMKALKPELDELKAKHGDDKQAYGVEQMALYKQAGVNPLGGCLPALVQMPIFFALFSYFPHAIDLRQKSFLWADDLSSYDSIVSWAGDIPLISSFYGNHISLFTILFAVTSLLLALYSMSTTAMDQSNPMLKYMPFIMPIMFIGIFNKFAAALTLYYFISNLVTLGLQFIIQKFIIDPDKIRAKILAKKNEPPKQSKFMKKMQEMQEQNAERQNQTRSQRRK